MILMALDSSLLLNTYRDLLEECSQVDSAAEGSSGR